MELRSVYWQTFGWLTINKLKGMLRESVVGYRDILKFAWT